MRTLRRYNPRALFEVVLPCIAEASLGVSVLHCLHQAEQDVGQSVPRRSHCHGRGLCRSLARVVVEHPVAHVDQPVLREALDQGCLHFAVEGACENPTLVFHEMRQFLQRVQGGKRLARLGDQQSTGVFVDVLLIVLVAAREEDLLRVVVAQAQELVGGHHYHIDCGEDAAQVRGELCVCVCVYVCMFLCA
jgi:hypothetical protein